jgi:hypothetical protein
VGSGFDLGEDDLVDVVAGPRDDAVDGVPFEAGEDGLVVVDPLYLLLGEGGVAVDGRGRA